MRKFFYLMAMVCTLGFFTACSSDDDPTIWDTFKGGDYEVWFDRLVETNSNATIFVYDVNMNVTRVDDTKAKVTITSKDNNQAFGIVISEALVEQKGDDVVISGSESTNSINATISKDNKVTVEIKRGDETYTASSYGPAATSELIGTWNTWVQWYNSDGKIDAPTNEGGDEYALGSVKINWETKEGTKISIPLYPGANIELPANDARDMATRLANADFTNVLKSVSFTSDGKIIAVYSDEDVDDKPVWKVAKNYATYKVVSDQMIQVFLNDEQILSTVKEESEKAVLKSILGMFKEGIPVNIEYSNDNNTAFFYVNKDFAAELSSNTVLKGLLENLKDEDLDGQGALIKVIAGQIPGLMEKTTKFQAGLELNRYKGLDI